MTHTTTSREELLQLLKVTLGPDPLEHNDFCRFCGCVEHNHDCQWRRAKNIIEAHGANNLEFAEPDDDEDKNMTDAELEAYLEHQDKIAPWHRNYRVGKAIVRGVSLLQYCEVTFDQGQWWFKTIWDEIRRPLGDREVLYGDEKQ